VSKTQLYSAHATFW